jgi:multiple sugar transport system permease protein
LYNEANKAWVCTINGTEYYLGLDGANHIAVFPLADIKAENAPSPAAMFMHRGEASEAAETIYLSEDDAYRIGAHRAANGTQTYVTTGNSNINGLMLTEDVVNGEVFSKFGINNFTYVLTSKGSDFMVCLKNTLILTVITVPISTILALLIAVALNSIKPLQRLLQTIFFLPYVTNSIAIGMVFAAMFNIVGINSTSESVGIINNILGVFGVERINWINSGAESWASFTALIIYIVWNALPFKILILLGGLQSINKQYYDAAKIDSTPKWRGLTRITVPLLSPMLTYTVITSFIGGFKEYSSVVGIFGEEKAVAGGANMNTIVGHIQNHLIKTRDYGLAGAAALMLFVIIFIVTMINLRISKKSTHY